MFARYCSLLLEFCAPSHEMRGRPPTQPECAGRCDNRTSCGEEPPVADPSLSALQIYIPSSSSGLVALAVHTAPVRRTRPHLTKRCRPFLLRKSVILILMRCSTRRLEKLCNTSMNHLMTCGTLLTSLCRPRTSRQSSLLWAGQNSTSLPRRKLWTNCGGTKL